MSDQWMNAIIASLRFREDTAGFSDEELRAAVVASAEMASFISSREGQTARLLLYLTGNIVIFGGCSEPIASVRAVAKLVDGKMSPLSAAPNEVMSYVPYGFSRWGTVKLLPPHPGLPLPPIDAPVSPIEVVLAGMRSGRKPSEMLAFIRTEIDKIAERMSVPKT